MNNLKKNIIKAVSIVMIAVITVMTPLSDYADTQGIGETHAVAPAVISLAKLFGVIAGAYGIYVASDKLAEETDLWENWTATNDSEAHKSIQDIKLGVASYIVERQLMKSVANYLGSKASENKEIVAYGVSGQYNTLPDNSYSRSFVSSKCNDATFLVEYIPNASYASGVYRRYYVPGGFSFSNLKSEYDASFVDIFTYYESKSSGTSYLGFIASDEDGIPLISNKLTFTYSNYYYSASSGSWVDLPGYDEYVYDSTFDNSSVYTPFPIYRTDLTSINGIDRSTVIEHSFVKKNYFVDYSLRGENSTSNETVLIGSAVTASQLDEIHNTMEEDTKEANNNIIQFPGNYPGNDAYKALSNAISIAVANALIQAGIGNNSGEDSGSDSEGSAEQVGLLRQILNALTDSNPIPSLREILELLGKKFGDISIGHNGIINSIAENSPVPTLREINEALGYKLGDIKTSLSTVIDAIAQTSPIQALEQIGENIASLPQQIADNVKLFISELFVPDTTEIEAAVDDLRTKFVFADSMITVVDDFKGILKSSNGPPVIYIDFTESDDERYHSVGRLVAVDFAWYERYKPYGDAILSAIIYAFFIWRMFRLIPNILNGVSSSVEVGSSSPGTLTGTIPTFDNPRIGKG